MKKLLYILVGAVLLSCGLAVLLFLNPNPRYLSKIQPSQFKTENDFGRKIGIRLYQEIKSKDRVMINIESQEDLEMVTGLLESLSQNGGFIFSELLLDSQFSPLAGFESLVTSDIHTKMTGDKNHKILAVVKKIASGNLLKSPSPAMVMVDLVRISKEELPRLLEAENCNMNGDYECLIQTLLQSSKRKILKLKSPSYTGMVHQVAGSSYLALFF